MTQITAEYFEGKEEWETMGDNLIGYYIRLDDDNFIDVYIYFDDIQPSKISNVEVLLNDYTKIKADTTEELEEKIEHAKQLFS
ncbi:MAG: hypothetical protein ACXAAH_06630 [Promethearchaeota archaeon]|jgi:hypothetical protein